MDKSFCGLIFSISFFVMVFFTIVSANAAVDTSSCDQMPEGNPIDTIKKQICFSKLAHRTNDGSVCSAAPDPNVCIGVAAAELDNTEMILRNLEGEDRDFALGVFAMTTHNYGALDQIESNIIHDAIIQSVIPTSYVAAQSEDVAIAPKKDYCEKNLRGDYDRDFYDSQFLTEYGLTAQGEYESNIDLCNEFVAAFREIAYEDGSCDNWLPSVVIEKNRWMESEGVSRLLSDDEISEECKEKVRELKSKLEEGGLSPVVNTEEEAWEKLNEPAPQELNWVLTETLINPKGEMTSFAGGGALEWWYPGERYKGKTLDYTVSETSISVADHHMDHGDEYWNVVFTATFTKPPSILNEGEKIDLTATVSGSGSVTRGGGGNSGMIFQYHGMGVGLKDNDAIGINLDFVSATINPSFIVPKPRERGEIRIHAGLWNCAPCDVQFVYKAQEAAPIDLEPITDSRTDMNDMIFDLISGMTGRAPPPGKTAKIVDVTGEVLIQRGGEGPWYVAREGDLLFPEDVLKTGEDGKARISFDSGDPDAGPEIVNTFEDATFNMEDFFKEEEPEKGIADKIKDGIGRAINWITRGWRSTTARIKAAVTIA